MIFDVALSTPLNQYVAFPVAENVTANMIQVFRLNGSNNILTIRVYNGADELPQNISFEFQKESIPVILDDCRISVLKMRVVVFNFQRLREHSKW